MASTYELIETTTLTSSASSVTFSSITQDYRDLVLVSEPIGSATSTFLSVRINGDSGTNYNYVQMFGDGSSAVSGVSSNQSAIGFQTSLSAGESALHKYDFLDYSATDKHKTILIRHGEADGKVVAKAARWANTSAITAIEIFTSSNSYASGSTFSLYGIAS